MPHIANQQHFLSLLSAFRQNAAYLKRCQGIGKYPHIAFGHATLPNQHLPEIEQCGTHGRNIRQTRASHVLSGPDQHSPRAWAAQRGP